MGQQEQPKAGSRVAVVGLGAMGLPMAQRLAEQAEVTGFEADERRAREARDAGVQAHADPAEAVEGAGFVLLAVRTLAQAREALFGPRGLVQFLRPTAIIGLSSTVGAPGAKQLGAELEPSGFEFLDMPVSGGPGRARTGDLVVFVGGRPATVTAAGLVLNRLASRVAVVGPNPGDGQALKTVNQLLCGVHIAAAAEAMALADALGLDLRACLEALGSGAAASFMLANRGPRVIQALEGGHPEVLSRVDIFAKDMGIVSEAGRTAGLALPVATAAEQVYLLAQAAGMGEADDSSIVRLLGPAAP